MASPDSIPIPTPAGRRDLATAPREVFPARRYWRWVERACWIVGGVALAWFFFLVGDKLYFQAMAWRRFDTLSSETGGNAPLHTGDLVGKLFIPRIGLSAVIVEGDDETALRRAIGHIPGTAFPGGAGTVGLAGHRDSFFRKLGGLRANDIILFQTRSGAYRYRVESTAIVDPSDVAVLRPSGKRTLTLVTCYPFHYIGSAPQRYVVTALQDVAGKEPSAASAQEKPASKVALSVVPLTPPPD